MRRLTRNCKITNLPAELKHFENILPDYDYATNELGFSISDSQQILDKLGQLEDIEEELGIDLIILLTAILKTGAYFKTLGHCYIGFDLIEQDSKDDWYLDMTNGVYYFKDYGKTWALTKEELK